jgi:hypothetical protein
LIGVFLRKSIVLAALEVEYSSAKEVVKVN